MSRRGNAEQHSGKAVKVDLLRLSRGRASQQPHIIGKMMLLRFDIMKEILSLTANFLAAWSDDKKLNHRVEVILITSEPKYGVDPSGEMTRQRQTDQYRFVGAPETIRTLAKKLTLLADEAEELPLANREP
jgi:hypothetical protein